MSMAEVLLSIFRVAEPHQKVTTALLKRAVGNGQAALVQVEPVWGQKPQKQIVRRVAEHGREAGWS